MTREFKLRDKVSMSGMGAFGTPSPRWIYQAEAAGGSYDAGGSAFHDRPHSG
jgi:hypothetical protein